MKKKKLSSVLCGLLIAAVLGLTFSGRASDENKTVLRVNGENVSVSEAMIYWRLIEDSFEQMLGDYAWDNEAFGIDLKQTAIDRLMASMIRVKTAQSIVGKIDSSEESMIEEKTKKLLSILGEEYCRKYEITPELARKVVSENYLVNRYETNVNFRSSDFEKDIQNGLETQFGTYESYDQEKYLKTAIVSAMMFYTGQWSDGQWTAYPDAQKQQILEQVNGIRGSLDKDNFIAAASKVADDCTIENNPALTEGAVLCPYMNYGCVYYGQIDSEAAKEIFQTPQGNVTKVIETEYGYLIVYVQGFRNALEEDKKEYQDQLQNAKRLYCEQLLAAMKEQRLKQEWERLEQESEIIEYPERLSNLILQEEEEEGALSSEKQAIEYETYAHVYRVFYADT